MERYGNSWRIASYIPEPLAQKLNAERARTRESESKCIARILETFLHSDSVKPEGV
jgi:hypothetical protein